jgi:hypothetical protein
VGAIGRIFASAGPNLIQMPIGDKSSRELFLFSFLLCVKLSAQINASN